MKKGTYFSIGITGHRDMGREQCRAVSEQLMDLIHKVRNLAPNTPIRIFSGLAEGTDWLAAEAILEASNNVEQLELVAVLPMPREKYLHDFNTPAKRSKFETLLQGAMDSGGIVELSQQTDRVQCYTQLGAYLANKSDLLVAVWDGFNNQKEGGTAHVVQKRLQRYEQGNWAPKAGLLYSDSRLKQYLYNRQFDFVYVISVDRSPAPAQTDTTQKSSGFIHSSPNAEESERRSSFPADLKTVLDRIDQLNSDYEQNKQNIEKLPAWLGSSPEDSPEDIQVDLVGIATQFSKADRLADFFQKKINAAFRINAWLTFSIATVFLIYAKIVAAKPFLFAYVGLFVIGIVLWYKNKREQNHEKYLYYRGVGEALRIEYYRTACGLSDGLGFNSLDMNLETEGVEGGQFIAAVIKNATLRQVQSRTEKSIAQGIVYSFSGWVLDQKAYYDTKSRAHHSQHEFVGKLSYCVIGISLCIALALIFYSDPIKHVILFDNLGLKNIAVFLMGFLPMIVATIELHSRYMAKQELACQYANLKSLFDNAVNELDIIEKMDNDQNDLTSLERKKQLLHILGLEASRENLRWLTLRIQRQLQPAHGG